MAQALLLVIYKEDKGAFDAVIPKWTFIALFQQGVTARKQKRGRAEMTTRLSDGLCRCAHPLSGAAADDDPLVERVGEAQFMSLGEVSHGTREFYREPAEITKRLMTEQAFTAVAVEADRPDADHV